jgi:hypothetical protein
MSRNLGPRGNRIHLFARSALLTIIPSLAFAQGTPGEMPKNAHANSYGSGWECDRGYREISGACTAVKVPANAYATNRSYGRGWECDHGYREVNERCVAVKVPQNGYLDASGDRWKCNRGYREVDETCVAVKVPTNGYLTDSLYGAGWKCERGYEVINDACVAVKVPENAHLDYSGNDWACNQPYRRQQGTCVMP